VWYGIILLPIVLVVGRPHIDLGISRYVEDILASKDAAQLERAKLIVEGVNVLIVFAAALAALIKWHLDERWKRRSAVRDRVKAFGDTPGTYNAQLMLAGRTVLVPLFDRNVSENPYEPVTPKDVRTALTSLSFEELTDKDDAIRNSFNDLLGRLSDFELDIQSGLLEPEDVRGIGERIRRNVIELQRKDPETADVLLRYINDNGYGYVLDLLNRYRLHAQAKQRDLEGSVWYKPQTWEIPGRSERKAILPDTGVRH
jgi:hypothetical protein